MGAKNIKFGLLILMAAGFFSFYLGFTIPSNMSDGIYEMSMGRVTLRAGHTHGMLIGLCNVVVGLLLLSQKFSPKSEKLAAWFCMASVLLPIGLILRGLTDGAMTFAPVAMMGGCALLSAFITLFIGYEKEQQVSL